MANITVDFSRALGPVKQMHAVGQPPFTGGFGVLDFSPMKHLQDAGITYSRLHDVGGAFGGNRYVDIPNIFRDFDADETDPANYDFAFTDALLAGMAEHDVKPIFRLGVTIENQFHIKAYRIHPPKDYAKWARICEYIIRHYNEGWADGFHYGIEYWEIWNEPDNGLPGNNQMWTGTKEQYYELYHVAATHLKACFGDSIKVGGYAATTLLFLYFEPEKYGVNLKKKTPHEKGLYRKEFLYGFFDYIKAHSSPIDFFSWHFYGDVKDATEFAKFIDRFLQEQGFAGLETHLNEWNGHHNVDDRCTSHASAHAAAFMLGMQNTSTDMLCYYDASYRPGRYAGFFHPLTHKPCCTYYSFVAFGKLYALGTQVACDCDTDGIYSVAAKGETGRAMMIANISGQDQNVTVNLEGGKVYLIDEDHFLSLTDWDSNSFTLKENETVYIEY